MQVTNPKISSETIKLFSCYTSHDVIELLEELDLMLVNEGVRRKMSVDFEKRYALTIHLLKGMVRSLDESENESI